ncbi:hypothetical protein [Mycolicibacterium sp. D5.8-2]|uniref:hypothetical protein n=1 Tax=Mycolicibacterium sp. D5.8-2 TaxID=3085903 RepID=UPI00298D5C11|nr:hypothetical protein [Mycolicibacterium sp. D5.8-2]MDW5609733.1 hypothetical protein [Mycolicibacterium sp. D5.8-2]
MEQPRPIDRARVGRIVLAALDQDRARYETVLAEVESENTPFELLDALGGAFIGIARITLGDNRFRQWANDYILHAQTEADS